VAHGFEHPPGAWRGEKTGAVIDNHARTIADAKRAYGPGEFARRRHHVRQVGRMIGDAVDIEEHRARNMGRFEFLRRLALVFRHVPGGIHHPHILQMI
jgi:hypothetical protein